MPTSKTKTGGAPTPLSTQPTAEPTPAKPIIYSAALFTNDDSEDFELTADQYEKLKAHLVTLTAPVTSDQEYKARVKAADERAKVITNLLGGNLDGHHLAQLETVRLMSGRTFCGTSDRPLGDGGRHPHAARVDVRVRAFRSPGVAEVSKVVSKSISQGCILSKLSNLVRCMPSNGPQKE